MNSTIEEIVNAHEIVLIDTSAKSCIKESEGINPKKIARREETSIKKFHELAVANRNIYLTSKICEEFVPSKTKGYLEVLSLPPNEKRNFQKTKKRNREIINSIQNIERISKQFVDFIKESSKILDYSEREEYKTINSSCYSIKRHCQLGNNDWDFLLTGVIASFYSNSTAMLTNDFGIISAWKLLNECNIFSKERLSVYFRKRDNVYIKA